MSEPPTVVIVEALRSPIGSFCGGLSSLSSVQLGTAVIKELLKRTQIEPSDVSEVIMGQILQTGVGQNPAKQSAMNAGLPITVPAYTINLLCGSGLKSIVLGCQSILLGDAGIVISGGQESMSQAPHCVHIRSSLKYGDGKLVDTLLSDGLTDAFHSIHMGVTAENVAKEYNVSRSEQDLFAARSQNRAEEAQKKDYFAREIVPVEVVGRKETTRVTQDELPRHGTTSEILGKLRPAFDKEGTVTAGNASSMADGAAGVVLMSLDEAKKRNLTPLAKIVGFAQGGVRPEVMGVGPIPAIQNLLKKINWTLDTVDLFELNEAFAAQSIAVNKTFALDESKVNINGGAIALGHPLGASGARVLVTLIHALHRTGKRRGIAALCIGGGMGIALAIELI